MEEPTAPTSVVTPESYYRLIDSCGLERIMHSLCYAIHKYCYHSEQQYVSNTNNYQLWVYTMCRLLLVLKEYTACIFTTFLDTVT